MTAYLLKLAVTCAVSIPLIIPQSIWAEQSDPTIRSHVANVNEIIGDEDADFSGSAKKDDARHNITRIKMDAYVPTTSLAERISKEEKSDEGQLITIKYKNGDLRNILRLIARVSGVNLVAGPEVTGTVTIELKDVHWEQALSLVLNVNGYTYVRDGNIIRVISTDQVQNEPMSVSIIPVNYAKVEELIPSISPLLTPERGRVQGDTRANVLVVTDIPAKLNQIEEVVKRLDQATPQVLIECRFVEIGVDDVDTQGVDWSDLGDYGLLLHDMLYTFDKEISKTKSKTLDSGTGSYVDQKTRSRETTEDRAWQYSLEPDQFRLAISWLLNNNKVRLISNPKVQTLDNKLATIRVAQTRYKPTYTYNQETGTYEINNLEEIYVGITLSVTPHINYDDYITLDVVPEVSNLEGSQIIQGVEVPITNIRQVETRVSLKDKHTVAIGGLIRDDWVNGRKSVPYLGDLPYVGDKLFSWESKQLQTINIVIFLTPTIIRSPEPLQNWDKQLRDMQITKVGDVQPVVSNYPAWHRLYLREQMLIGSVTNQLPEDHYWYSPEKNR
jgi:type IV pilus assembly protein PilQ